MGKKITMFLLSLLVALTAVSCAGGDKVYQASCSEPNYSAIVTNVTALEGRYRVFEVETGLEVNLPKTTCILTEIK